MARIRSVHPGLFTDEAFMSLSMAGRVALPGIWTECDDNGVFEYKPVVLKARIFPADNLDMSAILAELADANCLMVVEVDGRKYGFVRNFRKWQRPEKPKCRHPLPESMRAYVGLSPTDPQPVTDESPTNPRKSPQMKEEGGMMKEEGGEEKEHRARARAILEDEGFHKDDFETKFLSNIVGRNKLTANQTETLAGIVSRYEARGAPSDGPAQIWIAAGTREFEAWEAWYRKHKGKPPPRDARGGWYFPSRMPESEAA